MFIPVGWAHQVDNTVPCVGIAKDFISPNTESWGNMLERNERHAVAYSALRGTRYADAARDKSCVAHLVTLALVCLKRQHLASDARRHAGK
jgi:hypothetical protein